MNYELQSKRFKKDKTPWLTYKTNRSHSENKRNVSRKHCIQQTRTWIITCSNMVASSTTMLAESKFVLWWLKYQTLPNPSSNTTPINTMVTCTWLRRQHLWNTEIYHHIYDLLFKWICYRGVHPSASTMFLFSVSSVSIYIKLRGK